MTIKNYFDSVLIPSWQSYQDWIELTESIRCLLHRHQCEAQSLMGLVEEIYHTYSVLDRSMETLSLKSCPDCRDCCCTRATLGYDLKDLLFIYLYFKRFPDSQITKAPGGSCSCLSEKGCCLDRVFRPFICTWYVCPLQKKMMRLEGRQFESTITESLQVLKVARNQLEAGFVRITS